MKEIKIDIPEGYEIDKENSTFERIRFKEKPKIKTWNDLCNHVIVPLKGYYINNYSDIIGDMSYGSGIKEKDRNVFLTREEAISSRAASMISQLMPYYGGAITENEWNNKDMIKYAIIRKHSDIECENTYAYYNILAFRTEEYRDAFLENCRDLVKQYLMIK